MYLVINKCVTAVKVSNFSGHYLRNRSSLDIGVLGYIGIVQHKEHSPEVLSIPPGSLCILSEITNFYALITLVNEVYCVSNVPFHAESKYAIKSFPSPTVFVQWLLNY